MCRRGELCALVVGMPEFRLDFTAHVARRSSTFRPARLATPHSDNLNTFPIPSRYRVYREYFRIYYVSKFYKLEKLDPLNWNTLKCEVNEGRNSGRAKRAAEHPPWIPRYPAI